MTSFIEDINIQVPAADEEDYEREEDIKRDQVFLEQLKNDFNDTTFSSNDGTVTSQDDNQLEDDHGFDEVNDNQDLTHNNVIPQGQLTSTPFHNHHLPSLRTPYGVSQDIYKNNPDDDPAYNYNLDHSENMNHLYNNHDFNNSEIPLVAPNYEEGHGSLYENHTTAAIRDLTRVQNPTLDSFYTNHGRSDLSLDNNQRFYDQVGSRADGEVAQWQAIFEEQKIEVERLEGKVQQLENKLTSSMRISTHEHKLLSEENEKLKHDLKDKSKVEDTLRRLQHENVSLNARLDEVYSKAEESERTAVDLRTEIEDLRSIDNLNKLRRQHDNAMNDLITRHERDLSTLNNDLDLISARNLDQEDKLKKLQKEKDEFTKDFKRKELEMNEIINKLTKNLHESQERCHQLLSKGGNTPEMNRTWNHQLEDALIKMRQAEDNNKLLLKENETLSLKLLRQDQLILKDFMNQIVLTNQRKEQVDDSYVQLNIKRPDLQKNEMADTSVLEEVKEFINTKITSLDKFVTMFNYKKSQNVALKDELKKMEGELRANKNLTNGTNESMLNRSCKGSCKSALSKDKELHHLQADLKKLGSYKKKLETELSKKESTINELQGYIDSLKTKMAENFEKFEEDKKIMIERYEAKMADDFQKAAEALELEIGSSFKTEHDTLKQQLLDAEIQLSRVQQSYLECCDGRKAFENESSAAFQKQLEKVKEEHTSQISSLKKLYDLNKKIPKTMSDFSSQTQIDSVSVTMQVDFDNQKETELNKQVNSLLKSLNLTKSEHDSLKSDHDSLKSDYYSLKSRLEKYKCDNEKSKSDLLQQMNLKKDEIKNLKEELQNSKLNEINANEMKLKMEEDVMKLLKNFKKVSGGSGDNSMEMQTWNQKIDSMLSLFSEKKNEVKCKQLSDSNDSLLNKIESLLDKIELFEKESIFYLKRNNELQDLVSKLMEQSKQYYPEIERLGKEKDLLLQKYEKTKQILEECKLGRRTLMANNKEMKEKIQQQQKELSGMKSFDSTEMREEVEALRNNESRLKGELREAMDKILKSRDLLDKMHDEMKTKLIEMMESVERERNETIKQLTKDYKKELSVKDKERKILNDLLKKGESDTQKEIRDLKKKLQVAIDENTSIDKGDLGSVKSHYKQKVEEARLFYNGLVQQYYVDREKLEMTRNDFATTVKHHYIQGMRDYLMESCESSFAVEIMANAEIYIESIQLPQLEQETSEDFSRKVSKTSTPKSSISTDFVAERDLSQVSSYRSVAKPYSFRHNVYSS